MFGKNVGNVKIADTKTFLYYLSTNWTTITNGDFVAFVEFDSTKCKRDFALQNMNQSDTEIAKNENNKEIFCETFSCVTQRQFEEEV